MCRSRGRPNRRGLARAACRGGRALIWAVCRRTRWSPMVPLLESAGQWPTGPTAGRTAMPPLLPPERTRSISPKLGWAETDPAPCGQTSDIQDKTAGGSRPGARKQVGARRSEGEALGRLSAAAGGATLPGIYQQAQHTQERARGGGPEPDQVSVLAQTRHLEEQDHQGHEPA